VLPSLYTRDAVERKKKIKTEHVPSKEMLEQTEQLIEAMDMDKALQYVL
jgi:hypothetical protein